MSKESSHITAIFGAGCSFEGEILFSGTIRIDGNLTGRLICKNKGPSTVIISKNAVVEADIIADYVFVAGRLQGQILAPERIEIQKPGKIEGYTYTKDMIINPGALFQGACRMLREFTPEQLLMFKAEGFKKLEGHLMLDQP